MPDVVLDGDGNRDITGEPGSRILKNGRGWAIVNLRSSDYRIRMDGPGRMYLIGLQEYAEVVVEAKNGEGDLVWVPDDENRRATAPSVQFQDGPGRVRMGTWKEVGDVRRSGDSSGLRSRCASVRRHAEQFRVERMVEATARVYGAVLGR